jgi:signal transduction histidine kinase
MLSSIDLLENGSLRKSSLGNSAEFINLKKHVVKIDKLLKNVIKFSEIGKENKFPLKPCSLNEPLEEFVDLFRPSFMNNNYEIVTDFEADLPTIISSEIYLKQLFISIFSLMKSPLSGSGGYLVRTRKNNDKVQLIILSTDPIQIQEHPENVDLKVLKNLVTMHEGQIEISSEPGKGAAIIMNFPIKREI